MREQLLRDIEELIPVLRRYARFLAREPHNADDLVQDSLERAVRNIDQFRPGTNCRAWLLPILRNCFIDAKRRKRGQSEVAPEDEPRGRGWSLARQENHLLIEELSEAFLDLPDAQKLAIICVVLEGIALRRSGQGTRCHDRDREVPRRPRSRSVTPGDRGGTAPDVCMRATGMHAQDGVVVEVRLLDEDDLRGFASGSLDPFTTEAIEAYLLHDPRAASRVAT